MHVFIASDVYDYGTKFHFAKNFICEQTMLESAKYNQFEFGNLIYSSKTESEPELCVQKRARKYSVQ